MDEEDLEVIRRYLDDTPILPYECIANQERRAIEKMFLEYVHLSNENEGLKVLEEVHAKNEEVLLEQFEAVDHECSRLEKIDIEKDLKIQNLTEKVGEMAKNQLDIRAKCIQIANKLMEEGKILVAEYVLAQVEACPVFECGKPYSYFIEKRKIQDLIDRYNDLDYISAKETLEEIEKLLEEEE